MSQMRKTKEYYFDDNGNALNGITWNDIEEDVLTLLEERIETNMNGVYGTMMERLHITNGDVPFDISMQISDLEEQLARAITVGLYYQYIWQE